MICPHCNEEVMVRGMAYERHVVTCSKLPPTDEIIRMVKSGRTMEAIAREYGVGAKSVRRRIIDADPFLYKGKEYQTRRVKGYCKRCEISLSVPEAQPAKSGLCCECAGITPRVKPDVVDGYYSLHSRLVEATSYRYGGEMMGGE